MRQLQSLLTSVRQRRDLDLPHGGGHTEDKEGVYRPSPRRHKRKLIDFQGEAFKKWPVNQPIPYMFDGSHSESKSKLINFRKHGHFVDMSVRKQKELSFEIMDVFDLLSNVCNYLIINANLHHLVMK